MYLWPNITVPPFAFIAVAVGTIIGVGRWEYCGLAENMLSGSHL